MEFEGEMRNAENTATLRICETMVYHLTSFGISSQMDWQRKHPQRADRL